MTVQFCWHNLPALPWVVSDLWWHDGRPSSASVCSLCCQILQDFCCQSSTVFGVMQPRSLDFSQPVLPDTIASYSEPFALTMYQQFCNFISRASASEDMRYSAHFYFLLFQPRYPQDCHPYTDHKCIYFATRVYNLFMIHSYILLLGITNPCYQHLLLDRASWLLTVSLLLI